jgi:hypothetical protein
MKNAFRLHTWLLEEDVWRYLAFAARYLMCTPEIAREIIKR